jgi:hypothetical protein
MKPIVVVSGVIANKPHNGGNARMVLNWLAGLERLGADAYFVEQLSSASCVDAEGAPAAATRSANRAYFHGVLDRHGFGRRAVLVCDAMPTWDEAQTCGLGKAELCDLASDADLLINISGHLSVRVLKERFRRKVYLDVDPGYTQLWPREAARLDGHDLYYTVGQRIGGRDCRLPTGGITWKPTLPPVVIEHRASAPAIASGAFTTVASWRGAFAPISHNGVLLGSKAHQFRKLVELPRLVPQRFEVALDIHRADDKDACALRRSGWRVVDARAVASTPEDYDAYVAGSIAECSAAQGMYVQSRCGWFSDRTAQYLAAGKPVLVQDTGFCAPRRSGEGVVVFETVDEAAAGAARIARDYRGHAEAARAIAAEYFDSTAVIGRLLHEAGVA